jgi:phage repressor protein C with HTH and peptisase S24 domain
LRRRLAVVLVEGPSMLPALSPGDCLVVSTRRPVRPGAVVVARFAGRPELLVVKRAVRPVDDLWWVEGDNPQMSDDSRVHGPAQVLAVALLRYWPLRTGGRLR